MWDIIKGFFKILFWIAIFLQSVIMLVVLLAVIGIATSIGLGLAGGSSEDGGALSIEEGTALVLNPEGLLVEQTADSMGFEDLLRRGVSRQNDDRVEVHDIVRAIRHAARDEKIGAIVLDLGGLNISDYSTSKAYYIADELDRYKEETGRKVIALGDYYSQSQYIIAARADRIMLHRQGSIILYGYGRYRNYHKSLLDKLKVTNHVFRVGSFKSALEPVLRDDMSPEAKEANIAYLSAMWDRYVADVETGRDLPAGTISQYANNLDALLANTGGDMARAAREAGLVDAIASREEQIDYLKELIGEDEEGESFKQVGMRSYLIARGDLNEASSKRPDVAVVTVAGNIMDGEQPVGIAGGDTIAGYLGEALENDEVKAVVLRVDSPGGSAFASDVIRDKILALKEAGKHIVVSMGSLAASGGYWVAADADEIWATPATLTGSIGIFGYFITLENTVAEAGVFTDGVGTTEISSVLGAGIGPTPDKFDTIMQKSIENGYERFLDVVGNGRGLERDYTDSIAQGRVWIGNKAKELKLVDQLGSLDQAIESAARLAGIGDDYDIIQIESQETPFEAFMRSLNGAALKLGIVKLNDGLAFGRTGVGLGQVGLEQFINNVRDEIAFYESFNDPNATYARCLACE